MKQCFKCSETKDLEEFYPHKKMGDGHLNKCRVCALKDAKHYHSVRDKDSRNKVQRAYKKRNPLRQFVWRLKYDYGLTYAQYNAMFSDQQGCCAICKFHQNYLSYKLVVDHDHDTKKVRGLLCRKCNSGLGMFKDNPTSLIAAAEYLKKDCK